MPGLSDILSHFSAMYKSRSTVAIPNWCLLYDWSVLGLPLYQVLWHVVANATSGKDSITASKTHGMDHF